MRTLSYTLLLTLFTSLAYAQNWSLERSVQITAEIQTAPPTITLHWVSEPAADFILYRRTKGSNNWGVPLSTLPNTATSYLDEEVVVGESYEYRIVKNAPIKGEGIINAGIQIPAVEQRGRVVLAVDDTQADALTVEIDRLIADLESDGWAVSRIDVSPTDAVTSVKNEITMVYNSDPDNTKAVLLLGHIPVPYSGANYPDGHEDHEGAWPADLYYGEMNGNWTDFSVNVTTATDPRNHNTPGDGKFDQTLIPSDIDLQVGRIDFRDLPAFAENETQLLKKYLDKNHAFRHKQFTAEPRGLVENNFGGIPEGFGQNAWRNFSAMFGTGQVFDTDFDQLTAQSYLWSYGAGAGSYTSAAGITTTADLAADSLQTVFTMIFGSYFGDWDIENNLLRSALASGTVLTNAWAGRPKYRFEHMALGENIGYGLLLTQNTPTSYVQDTCYGGRLIHNALMGDPTLRMHIVSPPGETLILQENNAHVTILWEDSGDADLGYYVYRKGDGDDYYQRLHADPVTGVSYVDSCRNFDETHHYMVRALRLETSASGSYYNLSQGVAGQITIATDLSITVGFDYTADNTDVAFTNSSINATEYHWDFGDGNTSTDPHPTHGYATGGMYTVTLTASNACFSETTFTTVDVMTSDVSEIPGVQLHLSPIPTSDQLNIYLQSENREGWQFQLIDATGKTVWEEELYSGVQHSVSIAHLPTGTYLLRMKNGVGEMVARKIVVGSADR